MHGPSSRITRHATLSLKNILRGHSKSRFVEEVGRGSLKSEQKRTGGGGPSMCVRSLLKKKCRDFQNEVWYSPVFPIDYNGSMKYNKPPWKIIIFSPVNEWSAITFASTHKITNVGYVKNIYLQPLVVGWISV